MRLVHRWQPVALAACAALLAWSAGLRAEDAPKPEYKPGGPAMERKALDTALYNNLRDVINRGADLYNPPNGDWNGCYRLYEGALVAVKPLLSNDLQKTIDDGLAAARTSPSIDRRAFVLREVIDKVRDAINPNPKAKPVKPVTPVTPVAKSLWERLGGEKGVTKVVNDLFALAAKDPKVDLFRGMPPPPADKVIAVKKAVVDFIHDATKSPDDKTKYYHGKGMKAAHKGMYITNAQFDAFAADLVKALKDNGVKPDDATALLTIAASTRKDIVEGPKPPPPPEKEKPEKEKPVKEKPAKEKPAKEKPEPAKEKAPPAKEKAPPAKEKAPPVKEKAPPKDKSGIDL